MCDMRTECVMSTIILQVSKDWNGVKRVYTIIQVNSESVLNLDGGFDFNCF